MRGAEVTITIGVAGQAPQRFRAHVYDKWNINRWERTLTILSDGSGVPSVAEYVRGTQ